MKVELNKNELFELKYLLTNYCEYLKDESDSCKEHKEMQALHKKLSRALDISESLPTFNKKTDWVELESVGSWICENGYVGAMNADNTREIDNPINIKEDGLDYDWWKSLEDYDLDEVRNIQNGLNTKIIDQGL